MSDLAAQGDRLHACGQWAKFAQWANSNWVAIRAALRERDMMRESRDVAMDQREAAWVERDALRLRAETAEADADRLAARIADKQRTNSTGIDRDLLAAHAAAVEARP